MTLHPMNLEDVAEWMDDPNAIGRPSATRHSAKPEPVCAVSALRASVRRMSILGSKAGTLLVGQSTADNTGGDDVDRSAGRAYLDLEKSGEAIRAARERGQCSPHQPPNSPLIFRAADAAFVALYLILIAAVAMFGGLQ